MERTLVIAASAPVPRGNRVEVTRVRPDEPDAGEVVSVVDLDRGIRYQARETPRGRTESWRAEVRECTVSDTPHVTRTTLVLAGGEGGDPAASAEDALRAATAAADAAKAESDRWGGADRPPPAEPDRFW